MAKRERKRMTAGERIATSFELYPELERERIRRHASRIDAAIRKKGWDVLDAVWFAIEDAYTGDAINEAEKILGPRPARRK